MRPRSRIQSTGPNNGHQLRDYSKSSNKSENRPLILLNPRQVRLGECNYDYIEVISGLESGDQVIVSDMTKYKGKEKLKVE